MSTVIVCDIEYGSVCVCIDTYLVTFAYVMYRSCDVGWSVFTPRYHHAIDVDRRFGM